MVPGGRTQSMIASSLASPFTMVGGTIHNQ